MLELFIEYSYLIGLTVGLCASYFILSYLYASFFEHKKPTFSWRSSFVVVTFILLFSAIMYAVVFSISDLELGNRIQHALGGGFLAYIICFFVVRMNPLPINKFQFFVFSFCVVITLGVINEIAEFILQHYELLEFAESPTDTWLDLVSNTVGALVAAVLFTPFLPRLDRARAQER